MPLLVLKIGPLSHSASSLDSLSVLLPFQFILSASAGGSFQKPQILFLTIFLLFTLLQSSPFSPFAHLNPAVASSAAFPQATTKLWSDVWVMHVCSLADFVVLLSESCNFKQASEWHVVSYIRSASSPFQPVASAFPTIPPVSSQVSFSFCWNSYSAFSTWRDFSRAQFLPIL